jgi:hypothetical protein
MVVMSPFPGPNMAKCPTCGHLSPSEGPEARKRR